MKVKSLKPIIHQVTKANTASYAAALAYNFLFALFPLLLFLASLMGLLHLPTIRNIFRGPVRMLLAPSVRYVILHAISEASRFKSPTLLSLGAVGFVTAMSGALRQMITALNEAYHIHHLRRPLWKTLGISVVLGIIVGVLIVIAEASVTIGSQLMRAASLLLWHQAPSAVVSELIRWAIFLMVVWAILVMIYNWLPDHVNRFRWLSPGIFIVMILWILASWAFSIYSSHFSEYNKTYGSLGGVILLLLYLYILSFALLLGGEINALYFTDESQS